MKSEFIKNLKRIMFEKGITQKDLAQKLNTTQSFISAYQTGARNPKPETIEKIAKALDIPASILITNKQEKENKESILEKFEKLEKRISILEEEFKKLKK